MNFNEVFKNVRGYFREEDINPMDISKLDFKALGYRDIEDFKETLYPFKVENICTTKSFVSPVIYADYDESVYAELFDLSKEVIEKFVMPKKRYEQIQIFKEKKEYLGFYVSMYSNMLAIDFIKNGKERKNKNYIYSRKNC